MFAYSLRLDWEMITEVCTYAHTIRRLCDVPSSKAIMLVINDPNNNVFQVIFEIELAKLDSYTETIVVLWLRSLKLLISQFFSKYCLY